MKRFFAASLLLAGILWPAYPMSAQPAESCASLTAKRREAFDAHQDYLTKARQARSELAAMDTVDPAVIDAKYIKFTKSIKQMRASYDRATPDEKKLIGGFYEALEDGYAFWQAKKAHEDTGGIVDVPTANKYRELLRASLKSHNARERAYSADIAKIDREMQHCKSTHSNWSGTYLSGPYTITISGGFGTLTYKAVRNDPGTTDKVDGKCEVTGNVATCTETGTYEDADKKVERDSTATLTLSGDTISAKSTVTKSTVTLKSGQPCPDPAQCTGLHAGAEFSGVWTRKKP